MELLGLTQSIFIIFLQFSFSLSSLSKVWERFMTFSCEFSSDVEKLIPIGGRSKRSIFLEDPNFDNPEELFTYLYPLADFKPEDFVQESPRASSFYHTNSIYAWISDLGSLWLADCNSRAPNYEENVTTEKDKMEGKIKNSTTRPHENGSIRHSRSLSTEEKDFGGINYKPRNLSYAGSNSERLSSSSSNSRGSSSSFGVYSQPSSGSEVKTGNTNGRKHRRPLEGGVERKLLNMTLTRPTTTEAPTTTTAASASSDDNFFTSYGGDIEYFFPLISFGIPFDGEITFLGFHGFKGLFPYK